MDFTSRELPEAIRKLFQLNNFEVDGPLQVHGAEIDLVARHSGNPFSPPVYIEATVEYVDNDKYGKDVGKLAMIGELIPDAQKIIVSSKGFTVAVKERADKTRIQTLTYDELFRRFEKFDPYITAHLDDGELASTRLELEKIYEEPFLQDSYGQELATEFLQKWKSSDNLKDRWLVVTGDYGTGKTALTKIIQQRWLRQYRKDPSLGLPIRIELKNFTRQFDSRGLLHHFLDNNHLSHISVDFVLGLIREKRIILILDGYDEMAQYLNARERRACLEAFSELSAGGAKGLITSRPNYFTQLEELQVFEVLYKSLNTKTKLKDKQLNEIISREKLVDQLLEQFIDKFERNLRDLTPEQTESLVRRVLADDLAGQEVVLKLLLRIFRGVQDGDAMSLSGKPVIVSYLLEVVEALKQDQEQHKIESLSEWQVYELIVDKLMLRDFERTPELNPDIRRTFLQQLAVEVTRKNIPKISESILISLIHVKFKTEILRLPSDSREAYVSQLFSDLRGSTTLSKDSDSVDEWRFSHNSLREFLVSEHLLINLDSDDFSIPSIPVSDAMRTFVSSKTTEEIDLILDRIRILWKEPDFKSARGLYLTLCWSAFEKKFDVKISGWNKLTAGLFGGPIDVAETRITSIALSSVSRPTDLRHSNFFYSELFRLDFSGANLEDSGFVGSLMENVDFSNSNLSGCTFSKSLIVDCDFSNARLSGATFDQVRADEIGILIRDGKSTKLSRLTGYDALGFLNFHGASTDPIPDYFILKNDPFFPIADKILEKLSEQTIRQIRGLVQRGSARNDVDKAKSFVQSLIASGVLEIRQNRKGIIYITEHGKKVVASYLASKSSDVVTAKVAKMPVEISKFLKG